MIDTTKVGILVVLVALASLFLYWIREARRREIRLRKIPGLEALDDAVGRAAEMGRPVLYTTGILGLNNIAVLAAMGILRRVAQKAAEYQVGFVMPNADPIVMATAQEIVKEAYQSAGRPDLYSETSIFYLTSDQFGYAAGVDGVMLREKPGAVFLQGYFYAESLILAETAQSVGAIQIAGTTATTQLPFFVVACDYVLIGEEMLAASAVLSKEPNLLGSIRAEDWAKMAIVVFLIVAIVLKMFGIDITPLLNTR